MLLYDGPVSRHIKVCIDTHFDFKWDGSGYLKCKNIVTRRINYFLQWAEPFLITDCGVSVIVRI